MPITVTAPRDVLTPAGVRDILPQLTEALRQAAGAADSSIIGGTVNVLAAEDIYAAGANRPLVLVEIKLPNPVLSTLAERAAFITAATDIVDALTADSHDRRDTWINILNAPDGAWGIGGVAYSNDVLIPR